MNNGAPSGTIFMWTGRSVYLIGLENIVIMCFGSHKGVRACRLHYGVYRPRKSSIIGGNLVGGVVLVELLYLCTCF